MKHAFYLFQILFLMACTSTPMLNLVDTTGGYQIVIPENATEAEKNASVILQKYIQQISDKQLPILAVNQVEGNHNIFISRAGRDLFDQDTLSGLEDDGFQIYTKNKNLYFIGGNGNGVIYSIYTFLEKYLDCRMYAPGAQVIPKQETISIPDNLMDRQVPRLKHRHLGYRGMGEGEYALWNKISAPIGSPESRWGLFAESLGQLVPADKYYKAHPEYFALHNGKRVPSQLCLSNPEVLKIVVASLKEKMANKPDAIYWSVSQNDNGGYCKCEHCAAIDREEINPSGAIVRFVNQVAAAFPDKVISTLAYTYTRPAPAKTKPASNVNIMFSNIECNRSCPLEKDSLSASFRKDITDWSKITNDIFVWDYVIQFKNLVSPFPNLRTLQPNLKYFVDHSVTGIFEQGNREVGGEFSELRCYLLAKLMWDPEMNTDSLITDFTNGYYGKGGIYIKQYIDKLHDNLEKSGDRLSIFGNTLDPEKSYLSPIYLKEYGELFDKAEQATKNNPETLKRVQTARLPLTYVEIEQARVNPGSLSPDFMNKINTFINHCKIQGITRLSEWHTTPDEYMEIIDTYIEMDYSGNKALGKKVKMDSVLIKYNLKITATSLTDGLYGTNEYSYMWLRSQEKEYELVVDLEKEENISNLAAHFLNNNSSSVFLPAKVTFYLSTDGNSFRKVGEEIGPKPYNTYGHPGSYASGSKPVPHFYQVKNLKESARWVKVQVHSIGDCPIWHPDVGSSALSMIDEILVQ